MGYHWPGLSPVGRWWLVRLLPSGLKVVAAGGSVNFIGAIGMVGMF